MSLTGSGVTGGGVNTFYSSGVASGLSTAIANFYTGIQSLFPPSVTIAIPSTGDVLESSTGVITGTWTSGTLTTLTGTASNVNYAAGVGARVIWETGARTNNRPCRGSTFLVPISVANYDSDGTLKAPAPAQITDNAAALVTALSGSLCIWTRPVGGAGGVIHAVVSSHVSDQSSWLRSRKR